MLLQKKKKGEGTQESPWIRLRRLAVSGALTLTARVYKSLLEVRPCSCMQYHLCSLARRQSLEPPHGSRGEGGR